MARFHRLLRFCPFRHRPIRIIHRRRRLLLFRVHRFPLFLEHRPHRITVHRTDRMDAQIRNKQNRAKNECLRIRRCRRLMDRLQIRVIGNVVGTAMGTMEVAMESMAQCTATDIIPLRRRVNGDVIGKCAVHRIAGPLGVRVVDRPKTGGVAVDIHHHRIWCHHRIIWRHHHRRRRHRLF